MNQFAILAEPNRRSLLDALLVEPQPVNALVQILKMSQPAVSKQLRILRDAGFVNVTPQGQQRIYSVNAGPLQDVDAWLEPYREMWANRLDALEQHLEQRIDKGEEVKT